MKQYVNIQCSRWQPKTAATREEMPLLRGTSRALDQRRVSKTGFLRPTIILITAVLALRLALTSGISFPFSGFLNGLRENGQLCSDIIRLSGIDPSVFRFDIWKGVLRLGLPPLSAEIADNGGITEDSYLEYFEPSFLVSEPTPSIGDAQNDLSATEEEPAVTEDIVTPGESAEDAAEELSETTPFPQDLQNNPDSKRLIEVTLVANANDTVSGVAVNNDTKKYTPDLSALMAKKPAVKASDGKNPQILIIHTHGTESYCPDARDFYVPTDIERTTDTAFNVVRLGDEITEKLSSAGLNIIHDRSIYDSPSYNGSYGRALASIQSYMKKYPSIQMVIDIHRDSIQSADGTMYKTVSETDKGKAAQMMMVIGTDASGLPHDGWKNNLTLAARFQKELLDAYPTLMRPIHLRKERFNQHATEGSMILEVGTAGNTLQEALLSVDLFCETLIPDLKSMLLK